MKSDEGWMKNDERWMMMISSCWWVLPTDKQTFVNVKLLLQLATLKFTISIMTMHERPDQFKSHIIIFFWCTFLTCAFILLGWMDWNVHIVQSYWVCSPSEWNIFMCLDRYFFWIDLLHSEQTIFSLFWWTFLTWLDKLLVDVAW